MSKPVIDEKRNELEKKLADPTIPDPIKLLFREALGHYLESKKHKGKVKQTHIKQMEDTLERAAKEMALVRSRELKERKRSGGPPRATEPVSFL
jgi:hypothetical protein